MKKTMLSAEALKSLLATAETETPVVEASAEDVKVTLPEVEVEKPIDTAAVDTLQAQFDAFKVETEAAATEAKEKLAAAEAAVAEVTANASVLKDIVVGQISRMRLGLKIAAVDMASWSIKAVVEEFNSTSESFMKALPVGSVIPKEENKPVEKAVENNHQAASIKSLGF